MKTAAVLTGLLAALALSAQAISITHIEVLDEDDPAWSNVLVQVAISGAGAGAMANFAVRSADGLVGQNFYPTPIEGPLWSNEAWYPYFIGPYQVLVSAWDNVSYPAQAVTNTVVARTLHGAVNSVKFGNTPYNPAGTWTDIDVNEVMLHNIGVQGLVEESFSVGCNLVNANPTITPAMTEEETDRAFADTAAYKPAGTPFRFNLNLHARPTSIMGFGEIKRFIWTPDDTNAPAGPGQLELDVVSCSPWRNNYTTNLQAHVGFAPLFVTDPEEAEEMKGCLLCTSAHYMDVAPTNDPDASRIGLIVNGHSNTTSYLKMFIPDTQLTNFGITNIDLATNALMGYVTHFTSNNVSEGDTAAAPPVFTRIPGGTNIVYDYDGDGVGDSGYETRFNFSFHSPVAAEMGPAGETPDSGLSWVAGDFDGDRKADPAIYLAASGAWRILCSANSYAVATLANFGGTGWTGGAGDYDGDLKADPMIYNAASGTMKVRLSAQGYAEASSSGIGGEGYHAIPGDFDGDGKADLAVNRAASGTFFVKLSGYNYAPASIAGFGNANYEQEDGDYDGDGKADLAIYHLQNGHWYFAISSKGYLVYDYMAFGYPEYTPVSGDFDGDGKSDPTLYNAAQARFYFTLSGSDYLIYWLSNMGGANSVAVNGDFDGDGKSDPAVVDVTTGVMTVALSTMGHNKAALPLLPPQ